MASEVQKRLHEAIAKEPYPESRVFKKEAVLMVGDKVFWKGEPVTSFDEELAELDLELQREQTNAARRRRIYLNQYNRPFPVQPRKRVVWTDPETTTPSAPKLVKAKKPQPVLKPPTMSDQKETSNFKVSQFLPKELSPKRLWAVASCGADFPDDELIPNRNDVQVVTPQRTKPANASPLSTPTSESQYEEHLLSEESNWCSSNNIPFVDSKYCAPLQPMLQKTGQTFDQLTRELERLAVRSGFSPMKKEASVSKAMQTPTKATVNLPPSPTSVTMVPQQPHEAHQTLQQFMKETEDNALQLFVDDYQEGIFDKIVESLYGNTILRSLTIVRGAKTRAGTYRSTTEMNCLFEAMRCLIHLETLLIVNAQQDILPSLTKNLPFNLQQINLHVIEGTVPDQLLNSLAIQPNLIHVQLEAPESIDFGRLVSSPTLQTIKICGLNNCMDPVHAQRLGDALRSHPNHGLLAMDLEPELATEGWTALAQGLHFHASLQFLRVTYRAWGFHAQTAGKDLAELIDANTSLLHIENRVHEACEMPLNIANDYILNALKANHSLQTLKFFREDPMFWMAKEALFKAKSTSDCRPSDPIQNMYQNCMDYAQSKTLPPMEQWCIRA